MEHVQFDKEKVMGTDAWADVSVKPLAVPGPIVHNDHAYQLFVAEHQTDDAAPATIPQRPPA